MKFYKCNHCGQIVTKVFDRNVPIICCGEPMQEIVPQMEEAGPGEKHIPVVVKEGNKVTLTCGAIPHPSTEEHYIEWLLLSTNKGNQRKTLKPGDKAEAVFYIGDDEVIKEAYAFCNLHGLWKHQSC